MNEYHVDCVENLYQRESMNEDCVDLVGKLVSIMVEK